MSRATMEETIAALRPFAHVAASFAGLPPEWQVVVYNGATVTVGDYLRAAEVVAGVSGGEATTKPPESPAGRAIREMAKLHDVTPDAFSYHVSRAMFAVLLQAADTADRAMVAPPPARIPKDGDRLDSFTVAELDALPVGSRFETVDPDNWNVEKRKDGWWTVPKNNGNPADAAMLWRKRHFGEKYHLTRIGPAVTK